MMTILDEWETCHADYNIPLSLSSHIYTSNSHFQFLSFSGMDELSEDDKLTVARARKAQRFMSQPFHVAEVFTGRGGRFVQLEDTIKGFQEILSGKLDSLPEGAFYMAGNIDEVKETAAKMALA